MRTSLSLDSDLEKEVEATASLVREKPATVIRLALRAGLPVVASRFQAARPVGYFASAYPLPRQRQILEKAMAAQKQRPER
jgi:hypothetical protein